MNISRALYVSVGIVVLAAAGAHAQTGSYDDAMKQAEQYQKQYGGGAPGAAPGAMPGGVPGAGGVPNAIPGGVPAIPGGVPGAMPGEMPGTMPGAVPGMPGAAGGMPEKKLDPPIALTSDDVTSFITTMKGLKAVGVHADDDSSKTGTGLDNVEANAAAMRVLESNGFSAQRFKDVSYAVALGMAGQDIKAQSAEIAAQRAQREQTLAEMKTSLPPAQYEAISRQLTAADKMLDQIANQPQANIDVVAKHSTELNAVVDLSE